MPIKQNNKKIMWIVGILIVLAIFTNQKKEALVCTSNEPSIYNITILTTDKNPEEVIPQETITYHDRYNTINETDYSERITITMRHNPCDDLSAFIYYNGAYYKKRDSGTFKLCTTDYTFAITSINKISIPEIDQHCEIPTHEGAMCGIDIVGRCEGGFCILRTIDESQDSVNIQLIKNYIDTFYTCQQEPYCGDGICNGDESCSTCSADCGTCPSDDTTTDDDKEWYENPIVWIIAGIALLFMFMMNKK